MAPKAPVGRSLANDQGSRDYPLAPTAPTTGNGAVLEPGSLLWCRFQPPLPARAPHRAYLEWRFSAWLRSSHPSSTRCLAATVCVEQRPDKRQNASQLPQVHAGSFDGVSWTGSQGVRGSPDMGGWFSLFGLLRRRPQLSRPSRSERRRIPWSVHRSRRDLCSRRSRSRPPT